MSDWLQASVKVTGEDIQIALDAFDDLDALAVTQQNAGEGDYYDLAHPAEPGWQKQQIVALFNADVDQDGIDELLKGRFADFGALSFELDVLPDQDWESAWIDQYQPTRINQRVWVYPSWHDIESLGDAAPEIIVKVDPGLAFGTGTHPTTAMCLDKLSQLDLNQAAVMDYGCGSGILAIGALLMGASSAVGIDIDPQAEIVAQENAQLNGVSQRFTIQSAPEKSDQYQVVLANILAGALVDLSPIIAALVATDGKLLLSGILQDQATMVIEAYQAEFEFDVQHQDEWVLLTGTKQT